MRILSAEAERNNRTVLPVLDYLPDQPLIGEMVYFTGDPEQGIMLYTPDGWVSLYSTRNNYWETHIAEKDQTSFTLTQEFDTDGRSINVYKDGKRLKFEDYVEASSTCVVYREKDEEGEDVEIFGGEEFQFQIFNIKMNKPFKIKEFNRRKGRAYTQD